MHLFVQKNSLGAVARVLQLTKLPIEGFQGSLAQSFDHLALGATPQRQGRGQAISPLGSQINGAAPAILLGANIDETITGQGTQIPRQGRSVRSQVFGQTPQSRRAPAGQHGQNRKLVRGQPYRRQGRIIVTGHRPRRTPQVEASASRRIEWIEAVAVLVHKKYVYALNSTVKPRPPTSWHRPDDRARLACARH